MSSPLITPMDRLVDRFQETRRWWPPSCETLLAGMTWENQRWTRDPLSPEDRSWILKRIDRIEEVLAPPLDWAFLNAALLYFFASKKTGRSDESVTPDIRLQVYKAIIKQFPGRLVEHTLIGLATGQIVTRSEFLLDPAELRQELEHQRGIFEAELAALRRLLKAAPRDPETAALMAPEAFHQGMRKLLNDLSIQPVAPRIFPKAEPVIPVTVQPMPEAERELVEKMKRGEKVTGADIKRAEKAVRKG